MKSFGLDNMKSFGLDKKYEQLNFEELTVEELERVSGGGSGGGGGDEMHYTVGIKWGPINISQTGTAEAYANQAQDIADGAESVWSAATGGGCGLYLSGYAI